MYNLWSCTICTAGGIGMPQDVMPDSKTYGLSGGDDIIYGFKCLLGKIGGILILFLDVYFAY